MEDLRYKWFCECKCIRSAAVWQVRKWRHEIRVSGRVAQQRIRVLR